MHVFNRAAAAAIGCTSDLYSGSGHTAAAADRRIAPGQCELAAPAPLDAWKRQFFTVDRLDAVHRGPMAAAGENPPDGHVISFPIRSAMALPALPALPSDISR